MQAASHPIAQEQEPSDKGEGPTFYLGAKSRPGWQNATTLLIAINVAVFVLMVWRDPSAFTHPSSQQLIRWGADFGPLTLDNQPWRLVTSGFLHIGIVHILVNMWSLWVLGRLAERFVGPSSLIVIYLLTGCGASLASVSWDPIRVSAGASGPIFGFIGLIIGIAFFAKSRLDPAARKNLLNYAVRIAAINLFIGLRAGTDNMAHAGGLITGAVVGSALAIMSRGVQQQQRTAMRRNIFLAVSALLLVAFLGVKTGRGSIVYAYQGELALERKDYRTAAERFERFTAVRPKDPNAHATLGYIYQASKKYPEALAEYQRSLQLKPEQPDVKINIAEIYTVEGKTQDAIALFEANMSKVKMDAESYRLFGEALIQNREGERAENMLKNSLNLDASDPDTHTDMAKALRMQGRTLEANVELNTADELRKKAASEPKQVKP